MQANPFFETNGNESNPSRQSLNYSYRNEGGSVLFRYCRRGTTGHARQNRPDVRAGKAEQGGTGNIVIRRPAPGGLLWFLSISAPCPFSSDDSNISQFALKTFCTGGSRGLNFIPPPATLHPGDSPFTRLSALRCFCHAPVRFDKSRWSLTLDNYLIIMQ